MTTQSELITELMMALRRAGSGYHVRSSHNNSWLECTDVDCTEDRDIYLKAQQSCSCKPGTPDDQCSIHGYEAWKQQRLEDCPHCNGDPDGVCYHQQIGWDDDMIPADEAAEASVNQGHRWG